VAAIKTRKRGAGEPAAATAQVAPAADDTRCRWLMMAADRAGLASGNRWSPPDPALGWGPPPRIATRTLVTGAGSVRFARDFTLATLHRWGAAERSDDIAIVMSELLTNALRHALPAPGEIGPRRPIQLGLLQPGRCVLCAVADPGTAAPVPQAPGFLAETGRGLHIICALSDNWGYTALSGTGKVVWATFTSPLTPPPPGQGAVTG
jgi:anti-sigma regulatory factor (Ser/Thr protein kinase)